MRLPPDLAGSFGEPDDDAPPRRTVPETVTPGERFMEAHGCLWSVHDWAGVTCPCYGRYPGEEGVRADPSCGICGGTGESHLEPEEVAGGLAEEDARLLCFGGELLDACEAAAAFLRESERLYGMLMPREERVLATLAAAVGKAKGG